MIVISTQDYQTRAGIRDVDGLSPILELLKSEYAVIQKLALLALDRASQDGKLTLLIQNSTHLS